jgi:hypothetical protein
MYPKVGLVEETREEEKKTRKIVNKKEVYHICVGTRQTIEQHRMREKGKELQWRGAVILT